MDKERTQRISWFWKRFLNSQAVTALLIILLVLINLFVFTKVSYLFAPVWKFIAIVGLPIVLSGVLYYLLNPIVDYLEKKGVSRIYSIIGLFIAVIGLLVWGLVVIVPKIQEQTMSFIANFPEYVTTVEKVMNDIFSNPIFSQVQVQLEASGEKLMAWLTELLQSLSKITFKNIGNFFGAVFSAVVAIITMPFILFYLLRDGKQLGPYVVQFLPVKMRKPTLTVLKEMNEQISSYIRGQLTVAFAVAIMFMVGFSIIGLNYAITLGIMAGILNLIPYLGSFLAMVPAVFLGLVGGPALLVKVIVVFIIEQTIEGRFVSPLVLGSQLAVHPITILFVLLTSGQLFGLVGVILGIPFYAATKVVVVHAFAWYQRVSGLYEEKEIESE